MQQLQNIIETAFERRAEITPANADTVTREAVNQVIALLDSGALRVAEKIDGQWVTHQWLKKAVLLSFRINDNQVIEGAESRYFDKVPMKFADYDEARFQKEGFRVVPPAAVRHNDTTDCQTTSIAHEYLCRICIVPQETDQCADKGTNENYQFLRSGDIHDVKVTGRASR